MVVADDQPHAMKAAMDKAGEQVLIGFNGFGGLASHVEDLAASVLTCTVFGFLVGWGWFFVDLVRAGGGFWVTKVVGWLVLVHGVSS